MTIKDCFIFFGLLLAVILFSQNTSACECSWEIENINRTKAENYYANDFRGAIFKGKVKEITEEILEQIPVQKIMVRVDKIYKGDKKRYLTIYSTKFGCGVSDFEKGKSYIFVAHKQKEELFVSVCDYLFREFFIEGEFVKIFEKQKK